MVATCLLTNVLCVLAAWYLTFSLSSSFVCDVSDFFVCRSVWLAAVQTVSLAIASEGVVDDNDIVSDRARCVVKVVS